MSRLIRYAAIGLGALFLLALARGFIVQRFFPPPTVSVIHLSGVILNTPGSLNIDALGPIITRAFNVRNLKAVCLVINSPGGSAIQSELIGSRIITLAKLKKVPVYSLVGEVAASGGYWLACAGDSIIATASNSLVGSIGVVYVGFGFSDLMKKLGIERRVYVQGENKVLLDSYLPTNPKHVERTLKMQAEFYKSFTDYVTARRGERLKKDINLFDGSVWRAEEGLKLGLIDGIKDSYSFMEETFKQPMVFRHFAIQQPLLKRLLGSIIYSSVYASFGVPMLQAELDLQPVYL